MWLSGSGPNVAEYSHAFVELVERGPQRHGGNRLRSERESRWPEVWAWDGGWETTEEGILCGEDGTSCGEVSDMMMRRFGGGMLGVVEESRVLLRFDVPDDTSMALSVAPPAVSESAAL